MKYQIGDTPWYAQMKYGEKTVLCPDCFGQRALTVIKGDGSQVSIDCVGCSRGYEPPTGYVSYGAHEPDVRRVTIQRIEINGDAVQYGHSENYSCDETMLFDNKEDAEKRATELSAQYEQEELAKINQKHRHDRTWSWNAHYHRAQLKEALRQVEYHTAKLNVAKSKAKEATAPTGEVTK